MFDPAFGSRCGEFLRAHSCRSFVEAMLTLEAIRLAYSGPNQAKFVSRIYGMALVGQPQNNEQQVKIDIEFEGYPRLQRIVALPIGERTKPQAPVMGDVVEWNFSPDDSDDGSL
jgi:hypothetical protein